MKETIDKYRFEISISVAIIFILFLISLTGQFTTWKLGMENKIDNVDTRQEHLASKYVITNERIIILEQKNNDFEVKFAEINVKLATIEALLLEIKNDMKDKRVE